MKPRRFRKLLGSYGANPERWPEDERAAAVALLAASSEARALRERAETLDRMLDTYRVEAADDALPAQILAAPHNPAFAAVQIDPKAGRRDLRRGGIWPQFAALAGACVLGFVIGTSDLATGGEPYSETDLASLIFGDDDLEGLGQ